MTATLQMGLDNSRVKKSFNEMTSEWDRLTRAGKTSTADVTTGINRMAEAGHEVRDVLKDVNAELDARKAAAYREEVKRIADIQDGTASRRQQAEAAAEAVKRQQQAEQSLAEEQRRLDEQQKKTAANAAKLRDEKVKLADAMSRGFNAATQLAKGLAYLGAASEEDQQKLIQTIATIEGLANTGRSAVEIVKAINDALKAGQAAAALQAAANTGLAASNVAVATTGTAATAAMSGLGTATAATPIGPILLGIAAAGAAVYAAFKLFSDPIPRHIDTATDRLESHKRVLQSLPESVYRAADAYRDVLTAAERAERASSREFFRRTAGTSEVNDAITRQRELVDNLSARHLRLSDAYDAQVRKAEAAAKAAERADSIAKEAGPGDHAANAAARHAHDVAMSAANAAQEALRVLEAADDKLKRNAEELNALLEHRLDVERMTREERNAIAADERAKHTRALSGINQVQALLQQELELRQELLAAGKVDTDQYRFTVEQIQLLREQERALRDERSEAAQERLRMEQEIAGAIVGLEQQGNQQAIAILQQQRALVAQNAEQRRSQHVLTAKQEREFQDANRAYLDSVHRLELQNLDKEEEARREAHRKRLERIETEKRETKDAAEQRLLDLRIEKEKDQAAHDERMAQIRRERLLKEQDHQRTMLEKEQQQRKDAEKARKQLEMDQAVRNFLLGGSGGGAAGQIQPGGAAGPPGASGGLPAVRAQVPDKAIIDKVVEQRMKDIDAKYDEDLKAIREQLDKELKEADETAANPAQRDRWRRQAEQRARERIGKLDREREKQRSGIRSGVMRDFRQGKTRDREAEREALKKQRERHAREREEARRNGSRKEQEDLRRRQLAEKKALQDRIRRGGFDKGGIKPGEVNDAQTKAVEDQINAQQAVGQLSDAQADAMRAQNEALQQTMQAIIEATQKIRALSEALDSMTQQFLEDRRRAAEPSARGAAMRGGF